MLERLGDVVRRVTFQRSLGRRDCAHLVRAGTFSADSHTCPPCEEDGDQWVKLRMCLTCGSIGCCDSSRGQHARAQFEATGHPVMRSIEPGEAWAWCYPDQADARSTEVALR